MPVTVTVQYVHVTAVLCHPPPPPHKFHFVGKVIFHSLGKKITPRQSSSILHGVQAAEQAN